MPDQKFTFISIPEGYSARLQRGAVLHRLVGRCRSGQEIVNGTEHVIAMWRARLNALRQLGWQPKWSAGDWQFARNCLPAFMLVRPGTRRCDLEYICPFCYARRLHKVWSVLDTIFSVSPTPVGDTTLPLTADIALLSQQLADAASPVVNSIELPRAAHHLLVRTFTKDVNLSVDPADESAPAVLVERIRKVTDLRRACVLALKTRGACVFTEFVPTQHGWRMEYRELHVVDATYVLPAAASEVTARVEEPTRAELARAIADFCPYPVELMFGPAERLKVALMARVGMRLFQTYGILRQQRS